MTAGAAGCTTLVEGARSAFGPKPDPAPFVYVPEEGSEEHDRALLRRFAPVFVVEEGEADYNRIGTPEIVRHGSYVRARVDPDRHAVFAEVQRDRIGTVEVLELVYRVHFRELAFEPRVFFEMHRNAGVLAIVALRMPEEEPLLLTMVYTCGCYPELFPTERFPETALPSDFPRSALVAAVEPERERFAIRLASRTHRVRGVEIVTESPPGVRREAALRPLAELRCLPIEGHPGETASFFYTCGYLKGHVRGAWSPIEGLTAGVLLLDPTLGMDKDFGDPEVTGTPFYTSIWPCERQSSRLDRLGPFLEHRGFHLEAFSDR